MTSVTGAPDALDVSKRGAIQRLLVIHMELASMCTGKVLDEGASAEELGENILYYRNDLEEEDPHGHYGIVSYHSDEEAIRFAGLCSAVYSLPEAISADDEPTTDRTREVYLENSSLVFDVLEEPHIVAVAQIARRADTSNGGTPSAVGAAIRKSHAMFRLLRGGGIHTRLCAGSVGGDRGTYVGMDRLFQLRAKIRKLLVAGEAKALGESQKELQKLLQHLPIRSLRKDLRDHYDSFVADMSLLSLQSNGACRGIVEHVPAPIATVSGSHAFTSAPAVLSPFAFAQLSLSLRELIQNEPTILAIATFAGGQFAATEAGRDATGVATAEESCLLLQYLASFRLKMQKGGSHPSSGTSTPTAKRPFRTLALPFGSDLKDVAPVGSDGSESECHFLPAPSLSMLSTSDEGHDFEGPLDSPSVWAPRISIGDSGCPTEARVCLYDTTEVSFLVYLRPPASAMETQSTYKTVLGTFHDQICSTLQELAPVSRDSEPEGSRRPPTLREAGIGTEAGQDIIVIDRSTQSLTLLLHETSDNQSKGTAAGGKGMLWFYSSKKSHPDAMDGANSLLGPDCRYLLASYLSLDALLAFDDAAMELSSRRRRRSGPTVSCTLLRQTWIYAFSDGSRELYAFFQPKLYVTVADVQHAVDRIRKELLGHPIAVPRTP